MKKLVLLAIMLIGGIVTTQAQDVKFGFKGGVNFASITDADNLDSRTGYHLGAVLQFSLLETLALQPEVLYSAQGLKDVNVDYITIPVLAKLKLAGVLSLEAGPQFGFVVNDEIEDVFGSVAADAEAESFDFGIAAGAGVEFGKFFAQARYNFGITDVTSLGDGSNSVVQLSVGYYIF